MTVHLVGAEQLVISRSCSRTQLFEARSLPLPPRMNLNKAPAPPPGDEITKEIRKLNLDDKPANNTDGKQQQQQPPASLPLPQEFIVKYLGHRDTGGLWGIKHTREPVNDMVARAKAMKAGETLPFLKMTVSEKGVNIAEMPQNANKNFEGGFYNIDVISYGVQDLVYTRVFAMIVVREEASLQSQHHPFQCHAFVCDSRNNARKLTFALAQAFQQFSKEVKGNKANKKPKKFAIDLRSPEEIEVDLKEADSEA
ncbi:low density lipoprotein receptor adapter protein 1-B-like isoform X2 [Eriocheir sinensis]|uniref:low density lipoprotein receptor adapter protein 1-B-like isoform X2 n=1 Tax=Eriocheir sinensis TaxID=95602 RepID=UPI0021C5C6AB|nr:low density lipoprotein receptor adapter protein 1-B-like isoform X2 [Eriocheir sinensis]